MAPDDETADPFATRDAPHRGWADDASAAPTFPIAGWERYQLVRFIGQGGMGRVFLARDPRLHRDVAIKLVRGDDPESSHRLVREARAQARVSHDRVCKVYEVGEVAGHVYIAMQHIDGPPLGALADRLNVAEKALVIREAALGVHEAHRVGILHRDLKPANILVERAEDGGLVPFVLDFGLARSLRDDASATAIAVGTPSYMSPEQARGDAQALDRRADVYGLGATLYHLLSGQPPIDGGSPLEILSKVAEVEPRPLRAIDPDLPVDLEAIVLKCLEKDRSARYDSARALAEDLDRFLNGEPVKARPTGAWYRLRRRVLRHRRLAVVLLAALTTAAVAIGWGITTRLAASAREQRARRFTEIVERVEAAALYSGLAALHDVRPDRAALRTQMDELAAEIRAAGPLVAGAGHYALGRGHQALGEPEAARTQLELAWQHGEREPRVAYALAIVLGDLYLARRLAAERIQDANGRAAALRDSERRYGEPALDYLRQAGAADLPAPAYVAARMAAYAGDLDAALAHLESLADPPPWFYEAPALRGTILATRASRRWNSGDRHGADADFAAGRLAYAQAVAVGESVPALYVAAAELEYGAMVTEVYGSGQVEASFARAVRATSSALTADPDHLPALVLDARVHRRMAEHRSTRGEAFEGLIEQALAAAARALAVAPDDLEVRGELGQIHWQRAQASSERGGDPREALRGAIDIFTGVRPEDRSYEDQLNLGLAHDTWADYETHTGGDPQAHRDRAIAAFQAALAIDQASHFAWLSLGNTYRLRAAHPRAADPDGDLALALHALDEARRRNPEQLVAYLYSGEAHQLVAQRLRARGGDARPALAQALASHREGLRINPGYTHLHNGVGVVLLDQAREAWDHGDAALPLLQAAREAFERAVASAPELGLGHHNVGEALAQMVAYRHRRAEDPRSAAEAAIAAITAAIARLPDSAPPRCNLGMVHTVLAAHELERGRDPRRHAALAAEALDRALELDRGDHLALVQRGELQTVLAQALARERRDPLAAFDSAERAYRQALALAPAHQDGRVAYGHYWRARAEWERAAGRDPGPSLARGLAEADALLAARPTWPDARVLRASLSLLQADVDSAGSVCFSVRITYSVSPTTLELTVWASGRSFVCESVTSKTARPNSSALLCEHFNTSTVRADLLSA